MHLAPDPPLPIPVHAGGTGAAPLGFRSGQLEALKWIALASMLVDHLGRHLLGIGQETWVFAAGRLAFPLFAGVLGMNLARPGDRSARASRTTRKLVLWGAVAVLPSVWARGQPAMVNVLATLALGVAIVWVLEAGGPVLPRLLGCVVAGAAGQFAEFGTGGVLLVPAVFLACTRPGLALPAALLFLCTAWLNAQYGGLWGLLGTLAAVPVVLLARALPVSAPRWPALFYVGYPVHLAVIGWLRNSGVALPWS
ncbi:MAG TPA: TraX family protein [Ramlibacter sp.]|uniref:TraX family protein n=1 Tax=Ramlibacter sp. TaxID=1917967 RepID=UPI002D710A5E|nr:TraX family protein [Ramlibacter sp.]HZY18763.1 TraX family protein [Ramlibacter sp.]